MMATFIIILMVLGLVHYLFENCVLPDLRQGCRYRLFALRDRLRKMALNGRVTDDRAYDIVQDSLNNAINAVFVADYYFLTEVRQRAREEKVQAQVRARLDTLAASSDAELQSIHRESVRIFMLSCGMGMGGWLIYLMPITLIIAIVAGCGRGVSDLVRDALVVPSKQFSEVEREPYFMAAKHI